MRRALPDLWTHDNNQESVMRTKIAVLALLGHPLFVPLALRIRPRQRPRLGWLRPSTARRRAPALELVRNGGGGGGGGGSLVAAAAVVAVWATSVAAAVAVVWRPGQGGAELRCPEHFSGGHGGARTSAVAVALPWARSLATSAAAPTRDRVAALSITPSLTEPHSYTGPRYANRDFDQTHSR